MSLAVAPPIIHPRFMFEVPPAPKSTTPPTLKEQRLLALAVFKGPSTSTKILTRLVFFLGIEPLRLWFAFVLPKQILTKGVCPLGHGVVLLSRQFRPFVFFSV